MISIHVGISRRVIVLGPFAFKFARWRDDRGARGRRCNLGEAETYRTTDSPNRDLLCPVLWVSRRGWLEIQRAAAPLSSEEYQHLADNELLPEWDYIPGSQGAPFEYKHSDWGRYQDRFVVVDFAAHHIFSKEELERARAEYLSKLDREEP